MRWASTTVRGVKHDSEKPRFDLLPWDALTEVAKVLTFGARKYSDNNWRIVKNGEKRYNSAMLRHHAADDAGEQYDEESGLLHLAHMACCALFRVALALKEKEDLK